MLSVKKFIWNYVEFTVTDGQKDEVLITGQGLEVMDTGSENLIVVSAHKYFSYFEIKTISFQNQKLQIFNLKNLY